MILNDKEKTVINVMTVCWAKKQDEQMGTGSGGLTLRFAGGGSCETFSYKDPKILDADLKRVQAVIDRIEGNAGQAGD
jgi:hypothetical protein